MDEKGLGLFFDLLDPNFLDFQVPRSPNSQISKFPDFQVPRFPDAAGAGAPYLLKLLTCCPPRWVAARATH